MNHINQKGGKLFKRLTTEEILDKTKKMNLYTKSRTIINKNYLSEKNYWIVKPTDLYQGKCIDVLNDFNEIEKKCRNMFKGVLKNKIPELEIKEEQENYNYLTSNGNNNSKEEIDNEISDNEMILTSKKNKALNTVINSKRKKKKHYNKLYSSNEIIIQKYLDRPLLYNKRKFDIRCYVLVDSNLNVYFCREGHLKASSEIYNIKSTNAFIHITNHSLQKNSLKFEEYEKGNEISYQDFKYFLKSFNALDKFDYIIERMKFLVKISIKAVAERLIKTPNVLCFEIFGYDFIIDSDYRPWILEINNNPGLGISSPVIQKLVPRMVDDAFRLTIDKVFNTKYSKDVIDKKGKYKTKFKLDGFKDDENVFEFLANVNYINN